MTIGSRLALIPAGLFLLLIAVPARNRDVTSGKAGLLVEPEHQTIALDGSDAPFDRELQIVVTNHDSVPVRIERIGQTCGCLSPQGFAGHELKPGQSVTVPVTTNIAHNSNRSVRLDVWTNHKTTPVVSARIDFTAPRTPIQVPAFLRCPESLSFHVSAGAWREEFLIETIEERDAPPWIETVESASEVVRAAVARIPVAASEQVGDPSQPEIRRYRVTVSAATESPAEQVVHAELNLVCRAKDAVTWRPLRLHVMRKSLIQCAPSLVYFDYSSGFDEIKRQTVRILATSEVDVDLLRVLPSKWAWLESTAISSNGQRAPFVAAVRGVDRPRGFVA